MNSTLERLDKVAPPPREVLTIDEVASVIDTAKGTLRNMCSQGRMPFQVLKIGGNVRVSKQVLARYLDELEGKSFEEEKPTRTVGRPKNSAGFQRHAAGLMLDAIERLERAHRADLESVLEDKTYPPGDFISM